MSNTTLEREPRPRRRRRGRRHRPTVSPQAVRIARWLESHLGLVAGVCLGGLAISITIGAILALHRLADRPIEVSPVVAEPVVRPEPRPPAVAVRPAPPTLEKEIESIDALLSARRLAEARRIALEAVRERSGDPDERALVEERLERIEDGLAFHRSLARAARLRAPFPIRILGRGSVEVVGAEEAGFLLRRIEGGPTAWPFRDIAAADLFAVAEWLGLVEREPQTALRYLSRHADRGQAEAIVGQAVARRPELLTAARACFGLDFLAGLEVERPEPVEAPVEPPHVPPTDQESPVVDGPGPAPLSGPAELTARVVRGVASLAWAPVAGARSYSVEVRRPGASRFEEVDATDATGWSTVLGEDGARHGFRVRAVGGDGLPGPSSSVVEVEVEDRRPPRRPTLVAALDRGRVRLSWPEVEAGDLRGYRVERATQVEGPFEAVHPGLLPGRKRVHEDRPASGRRWCYRLVAVDRSGNESAPSRVGIVDVVRTVSIPRRRSGGRPLDAPTIAALDVDLGHVTIRWMKTVREDVAGLVVERRTGDGDFAPIHDGLLPPDVESLVDALPPAGWVYYRVVRYDDRGQASPPSSVRSLDVPAFPDPVAPVAFEAFADGDGIRLRWANADEGGVRITVHRRLLGEDRFRAYARLVPDADSYLDRLVEPGQTWQYQLVVEADGYSAATEPVGATAGRPDR